MEDRGGEVQLDQVSLGVLVTAVPRDAVEPPPKPWRHALWGV